MKISPQIVSCRRGATTALVLLAFVSVASGQAPRKQVVMRDAATHEQLSSKLAKIENEDPIKSMTPTSFDVDPTVAYRPPSLLSRADMVCFGGYATLIPKRAIIQIPKNYADRIGVQPDIKLKDWHDFYELNRGWITTVEVSRAQAEGKELIAEEVTTQLSKSGNLIVATFQGGPISIQTSKIPVETKAPAEDAEAKKIKP